MKKTIWIDIENTPHVLFFRPIIDELKKLNFNVVVTARNYGGVVTLLRNFDIDFILIGNSYGKSKILKVAGVINRIFHLYFYIKSKNIFVSVSHGSRTHIGASWLGRIPSLTSYDYEYSSKFLVHQLASKVIVPELILSSYYKINKIDLNKISAYHGFKEEIYLKDFSPDEDLLKKLNIDESKIIVLIRPPAQTAHYYTEKSKSLFYDLIYYIKKIKDVFIIFSPRDIKQKELLKNLTKKISNKIILETEVDGLSLTWSSDLVISGGGTMNREAALLGVSTYSIFGGKIGCLDKELVKQNKLHLINNINDLKSIQFEKRKKNYFAIDKLKKSLVKSEFVNSILSLIDK